MLGHIEDLHTAHSEVAHIEDSLEGHWNVAYYCRKDCEAGPIEVGWAEGNYYEVR